MRRNEASHPNVANFNGMWMRMWVHSRWGGEMIERYVLWTRGRWRCRIGGYGGKVEIRTEWRQCGGVVRRQPKIRVLAKQPTDDMGIVQEVSRYERLTQRFCRSRTRLILSLRSDLVRVRLVWRLEVKAGAYVEIVLYKCYVCGWVDTWAIGEPRGKVRPSDLR